MAIEVELSTFEMIILVRKLQISGGQQQKCLLYFFKSEAVSISINFYGVAFGEFSGEDFGGKRIFQSLLNSAF